MYHTLYAMAEVPMNMLLEYFFHERLTSSDGIFENKMVGLNNVVTLIFVTALLFVSIDFLMAQIIPESENVVDDDRDGKLQLNELLTGESVEIHGHLFNLNDFYFDQVFQKTIF